jgi:serine O-acetyltransferase
MNDLLNKDLGRLTRHILASYEGDKRTRRIGERFLPSHSTIVEILDLTRQILFPGYFGLKQLTRENVKFHVGHLLVRLGTTLTEQINHCMCSARRCEECTDPEPCHEDAAKIAHEFLTRIPAIREMLALDAQAAYDGDPAAKSIDEVIYCYPGFYAVTVYRVAHEILELGVPLMARIMTEHAHGVTGCDIHPGAKIGRSFFIDHATGVVVGETARIGDNVKMYQGVTLGALSFPKDKRGRVIKGLKRHPTIEDNVTLYAHATILGGKTVIGKGVTVSGNTFVTESISADSVVTQEAPRLKVHSKPRGSK